MVQQMTMTRKLARSASEAAERYSGGADRPLRGYSLAMATYAAVVGTVSGAAVLTRRKIPDGLSPYEALLSAAATQKISRLLSKDPVTSPLRAPFASYQGTSGPAELSEEARGAGERHTIGELLTCPFCTEVWVATGLTAGLVFLPRFTRLVTATFAALAGADLLQFAHAGLARMTGEAQS